MIRIFLPLLCAALGIASVSCSQSGPFGAADAPASAPPPAHRNHGTAAAAMAAPQDPAAAAAGPQASTPAAAAPQASAPPPASPQASAPVDATPPEASQGPDGPAASESPQVPASTPLERRASTLIGMPVVSEDGTSLGEVKDIIFDRLGRATHLVIAYATPQGGAGEEAPQSATSGAGSGSKLTAMPWDAALASIKGGRLVLDVAKLQSAPSFTPDAWPNLADPAWSSTTDSYWRKAVRASIAAHPGTPIDSTSRRRSSRTRDGN